MIFFLDSVIGLKEEQNEPVHQNQYANQIFNVKYNDHVFTQDELDLLPADETIVLTQYGKDQLRTTKTDEKIMKEEDDEQEEDPQEVNDEDEDEDQDDQDEDQDDGQDGEGKEVPEGK